jgi:hypothetical protein
MIPPRIGSRKRRERQSSRSDREYQHDGRAVQRRSRTFPSPIPLQIPRLTTHAHTRAQACFFVFYLLLEIPSQFILKRLGPRWYLSILIVACGIVMASGAAITTPTGFVMMRLALGICESGLFPVSPLGHVFVQEETADTSVLQRVSTIRWRSITLERNCPLESPSSSLVPVSLEVC